LLINEYLLLPGQHLLAFICRRQEFMNYRYLVHLAAKCIDVALDEVHNLKIVLLSLPYEP
jgi:hypothetical protein